MDTKWGQKPEAKAETNKTKRRFRIPMTRTLPSFVALIAGALVIATPAARAAVGIDTIAKEAYMIDVQTGTVLLDKNGEKAVPPSSMAKMMTIYTVFDRIKSGQLSLKDKFLVSEKAWRKGGSKMFVEVGKRISVENLIQGVIVDSGNDAAIVLAEGLAGTEDAFADVLNREAKRIGLKDSHFVDANGWPVPGEVASARDLAHIALRTMQDFPALYKRFYSEKSFTWHGIKQGNRNPLLYMNMGCDGLKTGHTEIGGFGLTASCVRDGRRLILVVNGLGSIKERAQEPARLIDWGFRTFNDYTLFKKGQTVETAPVWLGTDDTVPLVIDHDLTVTLPRTAERNAKITVDYKGPIPAPIEKGTVLATLKIAAPNVKTIEVPLRAGKSVGQLGFMGRLSAAVRYLLWGNQQAQATPAAK